MEFLISLILFIVVGFWILFKFLPRILAWYLQRKLGRTNYYNKRGNEGDVTVTTLQEKEKVIKEDIGEYVDFEEEKETYKKS